MVKDNYKETGVVIRSTGSFYTVQLKDGTIEECKLRGKFRTKGLKATNPVAVGDIVTIETKPESGTSLIVDIAERKNYIIRKSVNLSKVSHIIASNIDTAFILASLTFPRTSTGFIDRFLVTAQAYEIPAALIFNKIDIYQDEHKEQMNRLISIYSKIGYFCYETSALTGEGTDKVKALTKNKTSLFAGHSGVGKSALINTIEPGLNLKTGKLSEVHKKGKHTTTYAQMHSLSFGGYIVDTPGIKEFGLIDFEKGELAMFFPEMLKLVQNCQYYNCTHVHEPGCAVIEGLKDGEVSNERYKNYLNMLSGRDMQKSQWELK